ncbi:uncharacterized protein LACBIDRAFT_293617 [Laccaria bicolor S238N-H82]|uniref:Predicted protein n=1 Tax=Laccaria bicolor (strain S238N-H82 / ATCC MYA-4686) TaxID=486041 RepID=B0D4N2_LACBS|nr:uncharacterized protein LACBIDRAFT_293617 [Laccaria bicolor S238N-H82]EDR10594.1 predicted protein [Laccaria bicolor S238N-H82]|eukprot:XP_001879044.1 predicted protein [Laccaria bicolor S238N-H82]
MGGAESVSPTPREPVSEDLSSYFNKSAAIVRTYTDRFEHQYARPVMNTSQAFFDDRPISAIFVAIFSTLSFLPAVTFLGISLFIIFASTVTALVFAFLAAAAVVLTLLTCLVSTLIATAFASAFLTFALISSFLFLRIVILVHRDGVLGISAWVSETKQRLIYVSTPRPPTKPPSSKRETGPLLERSDSPSSSVIVVQEMGVISRPSDIKHERELYDDYGAQGSG